MLLDEECRRIVGANQNMAVPWYLMSAYLYYDRDQIVIGDHTFDWLCQFLEENWLGIDHWHKGLIDLEALSAGTCLADYEKWPSRILYAASVLLKRCRDGH